MLRGAEGVEGAVTLAHQTHHASRVGGAGLPHHHAPVRSQAEMAEEAVHLVEAAVRAVTFSRPERHGGARGGGGGEGGGGGGGGGGGRLVKAVRIHAHVPEEAVDLVRVARRGARRGDSVR